MRLAITVELLPSHPGPTDIHAGADASEKPLPRWVASLDLRTIVAVLAFAGSLITVYSVTVSRLSALETAQAVIAHNQQEQQADIKALNTRVTQETVSRANYEHDTAQLNLMFGSLQSGQQEIYNALVQANSSHVYTPPLRKDN